MKITWNELTIAPSNYDSADLLTDWQWLLGDDYQIILVSSLGDVFLAYSSGHIHWLDAGAGRLTEIAGSLDEFQQLSQDPSKLSEWFHPNLIGDIMESGGNLTPGQCFSYKVAPALGGQLEPSNFEATDLSVHLGILGQIHEQIRNLPPGTRIGKIRMG